MENSFYLSILLAKDKVGKKVLFFNVKWKLKAKSKILIVLEPRQRTGSKDYKRDFIKFPLPLLHYYR